ncbi:hypothetical protein ACFE04_011145 [Oxalis oulophora]
MDSKISCSSAFISYKMYRLLQKSAFGNFWNTATPPLLQASLLRYKRELATVLGRTRLKLSQIFKLHRNRDSTSSPNFVNFDSRKIRIDFNSRYSHSDNQIHRIIKTPEKTSTLTPVKVNEANSTANEK